MSRPLYWWASWAAVPALAVLGSWGLLALPLPIGLAVIWLACGGVIAASWGFRRRAMRRSRERLARYRDLTPQCPGPETEES
jgi:hypothetical protein